MPPTLDRIVRPEIRNDEFFHALNFLAQHAEIGTVLEIGASSGAGSTEALAQGIRQNKAKPVLFTIEASRARFQKLQQRYRGRADVKPCNVSSVGIDDFADEAIVREFYRSHRTRLNDVPEDQVVAWLREDRGYLIENRIPLDGIARIRSEHNLAGFDFVLIDGSEFTGRRELELTYGARLIALDDINSFKNFENHDRLSKDPAYDVVMMNRYLRNGYSIFVRRGSNVLSPDVRYRSITAPRTKLGRAIRRLMSLRQR
jgi:hypothetical protein